MNNYITELQPDNFYHIWTHANGNDNLFLINENFDFFLQKYLVYIQPVADTLAWCLLPNHCHFCIKTRNKASIMESKLVEHSIKNHIYKSNNMAFIFSNQFSRLFNSYTKAFNKRYERRGSLFQRPFKRKQVIDINYLASLIAYIHNNPLHHGLASHINDWPYTSWHSYADKDDSIVDFEKGFNCFNGLNHFQQLHEYQPSDNISTLFGFQT